MIEHDHPGISVCRQCELIGLSRSTAYHLPAGESAYNLHLMHLIDRYLICIIHSVLPNAVIETSIWNISKSAQATG